MANKKLCKNQTAVKCPGCGMNNHTGRVEFVETIPSCRNIHGLVNGVLYIDVDSEEVWDDAYNQTLHCRNCGTDWDLPSEREYVGERQFHLLSKAGA